VKWGGRVGVGADFGGNVSIFGHTVVGFQQQLFDIGKDF
jgi:hypothetical protein